MKYLFLILALLIAVPSSAQDKHTPPIITGASVIGGSCSGGQFVTAISASGGVPTCTSVLYSNLSPTPTTSGQVLGANATVPEWDTITGDTTFTRSGANAYTSTTLKINGLTPGGTCGANQFTTSINSSGVPTCSTLPAAQIIPNGNAPQFVGFSAANTPESETLNGAGIGACVMARTGANAYQLNCPGWAPLASPTFTGTVTAAALTTTGTTTLAATTIANLTIPAANTLTFPDGATYTSTGLNNSKGIGIGTPTGSLAGLPALFGVNSSTVGVNPVVVIYSSSNTDTAAEAELSLTTGSGASLYPFDIMAFGPAYNVNSNFPANSAAIFTSEPNGLQIGDFTTPNKIWFNFGGTTLATMYSATNSINYANTTSDSIEWGSHTTPVATMMGWGGGPAIYISGGTHYTGSAWIADATGAGTVSAGVGNVSLAYNSGLTVGNSYTPQVVATADNGGFHVAVGNIYYPGHGGPLISDGTWTPQLQFGGATTGITYQGGFPYGYYHRVGQLVSVQWGIWLSSKGSATGNATLCGLPYVVNNNGSNSGPFGVTNYGTLGGLADPWDPRITWGGNGGTCVSFSAVNNAAADSITGMTNAHFGGNDNLQGSFWYTTDSW